MRLIMTGNVVGEGNLRLLYMLSIQGGTNCRSYMGRIESHQHLLEAVLWVLHE